MAGVSAGDTLDGGGHTGRLTAPAVDPRALDDVTPGPLAVAVQQHGEAGQAQRTAAHRVVAQVLAESGEDRNYRALLAGGRARRVQPCSPPAVRRPVSLPSVRSRDRTGPGLWRSW